MLKNKNCVICIHKTGDIYKGIAEDVETRLKTSNYELDRPLSSKIKTKFVELRSKSYNYLIDDGGEDKKAKGTKKYVIKTKLKFESHKNY